jgi:hypothetical protein
MCTVYQGPPRLEVWGQIIQSLEDALVAKKSGWWTSHLHANLKGR